MGKITRRGSAAVAVAAAATLAFAPSALADPEDGPAPNLYRFAGEDRIGTSISAAERGTFEGDTIIVANSEEFPDALAAAPLAAALGAPVILDKPNLDKPSTQVAEYGERLLGSDSGVFNVILASGEDVFSDKYKDAIETAFPTLENVDRVAGDNRYETARDLAIEAIEQQELDEGDVNVFLADGTIFPDALAAGAAAANNDGVVLLTKGSTGIDASTVKALDDYSGYVKSTIAVGGPAAAGADAGLYGRAPVAVDERHIGANRYETATIVANGYFGDTTKNFVLTSGENFPDAVVGGSYAANRGGPLLLTPESHLTSITSSYLEESSPWVNGYTFGGFDSVSEDVTDQLTALWTN